MQTDCLPTFYGFTTPFTPPRAGLGKLLQRFDNNPRRLLDSDPG